MTAIEPVMRANDGAWIGWAGGADDDLEPFEDDGLSLVPVPLSQQQIEEFYEGFSNATLWPLYHDVVAKPEFHREWWEDYVTVNRRFAERAAQIAADGATVWVQDYQLQLVPALLREVRPDLPSASSCTSPSHRPSCSSSSRGAGRCSKVCWGRTWSASSGPTTRRTSSAWSASASATRPTATSCTCRTAASCRPASFPISIDGNGLEQLAGSTPVE